MNKPPAFQFYARNFLEGSAHFTNEETGIYIRLLCHQWERGGLPNDLKRICILAGNCTEDACASVMLKFSICKTDGLLKNAVLEETREKQKLYRKSRSENAKSGWRIDNKEFRKNAHAKHMHQSSISTVDALQSTSASASIKPLTPFGETLPEIPKSLQDPKFQLAWEKWKKHRKEIKKPLKFTSASQQLERLEALGIERAVAMINHTIFKGWEGLKEPDLNGNHPFAKTVGKFAL